MRPIVGFVRLSLLEATRARLIVPALIGLGGVAFVAAFGAQLAVTEGSSIALATIASLDRLVAVTLVALFVAGSLLRELQDRNLHVFLAFPVSRASYYVGRQFGYMAVAVAMATLFAAPLVFFASLPAVLYWTLSLVLELLMVVALVQALVMTFHQLLPAMAATFASYLLARSIDELKLLAERPLLGYDSAADVVFSEFISFLALVVPPLGRYGKSEWLLYAPPDVGALSPMLLQAAVACALLSAAGLADLYRRNL